MFFPRSALEEPNLGGATLDAGFDRPANLVYGLLPILLPLWPAIHHHVPAALPVDNDRMVSVRWKRQKRNKMSPNELIWNCI